MDNKHELIAKVEKEKWHAALKQSFDKNVKEVKMDGFRKGKVPRDVYEKKYGIESLYMDAVDIILPEIFQETIKNSGLTPVAQPNVDIKNIDKDSVEFMFTVITKPEVKIKKYKKLKVEKPKLEITDTEVKKEIEHLKEKYAEIVLKNDKIAEGDTVVIDFEGFKDGKAFDGGKGENYPLEIGSKTFIPGFEEQLIGLKANDKKEIKITFPEEYPSEELKGQEVIFKVKVNEVKTKVIPEINDEFFKDLGIEGVTNEKDLFNHVKEQIKETKLKKIEDEHIDNVLAAVANETTVDIPEEMVTDEIHRMIHQFEERMKLQGITLEQYCQMTGTTHEAFHEQFHDEAAKTLLYRLIIEEIANLEKIEVTDEEAKDEAKKMAEKYQVSEEQLLTIFGDYEMIKYDLKMRRALEVLKDNN
ncbi:MAG: trigger factor [Bacilli bacterium]|nr:trigger factor [Bacilli bacterium]